MKLAYSWLQTYFDTDLPKPEEIERVLGLQAFEPEGIEVVNGETVLDFDVLPNRAHDCLCHKGIADEVAILFALKKTDKERYQIPEQYDDQDESGAAISATVDNDQQCRRFSVRVIENIEIKESPAWLKHRLEALGQRSINNVVDATNYVMFDLGQPTHVFDYDKIDGGFVIRSANEGETMTLLGGDEIELKSHNLLVADEKKILSLAGVKGGTLAEVDEKSTNIVLEAGNWEPTSTRKTSRPLNLLTDASKRFENDLSPDHTIHALDALTKMILEIAGTDDTKIGPIADVYPNPEKPWQVSVSLQQTNQLLGTNLSTYDVEQILTKAEYTYSVTNDVFTVDIPYLRRDLHISEDLIEEIGRIHGYDNVPTVVPDNTNPAVLPEMYYTAAIRHNLTQNGWSEILTYTFADKGEVEMNNALASDKSFLRSNLYDQFAERMEANLRNAELFGNDSVQLFEIGSVFRGGEQRLHLIAGFASQQKKARYDMSQLSEVLRPILKDLPQPIQHTDHIYEFDLTDTIAGAPQPASYGDIPITHIPDDRRFVPFSPYPFVLRDIAVWMPETTDPQDLVTIIEQHAQELLVQTPRQIDKFTKDGRTSYAYRIVFQSHDKTLTDVEVNEIMDMITTSANKNEGWEVR